MPTWRFTSAACGLTGSAAFFPTQPKHGIKALLRAGRCRRGRHVIISAGSGVAYLAGKLQRVRFPPHFEPAHPVARKPAFRNLSCPSIVRRLVFRRFLIKLRDNSPQLNPVCRPASDAHSWFASPNPPFFYRTVRASPPPLSASHPGVGCVLPPPLSTASSARHLQN